MSKWIVISLIAVVVLASLIAPKSGAVPTFYKEFRGKYVDENENEEFAKTVKAAKCYVCHIGKKRKNRNDYGKQLSELLDKKKDKKNTDKIRKALDTVAALPVKPDDEESPTFGDLIEKGKLPGGKPQKKDPEGEDEG